jgi:hypothetical protein
MQNAIALTAQLKQRAAQIQKMRAQLQFTKSTPELIAHNARSPIEFSAIIVPVIRVAGTIAELPTGDGNLK